MIIDTPHQEILRASCFRGGSIAWCVYSKHNRKLRLRDVITREGKSERTIARDVERGHLPAPHYDETGHRWWFEWELDANDKRIMSLGLGRGTGHHHQHQSGAKPSRASPLASVRRLSHEKRAPGVAPGRCIIRRFGKEKEAECAKTLAGLPPRRKRNRARLRLDASS